MQYCNLRLVIDWGKILLCSNIALIGILYYSSLAPRLKKKHGSVLLLVMLPCSNACLAVNVWNTFYSSSTLSKGPYVSLSLPPYASLSLPLYFSFSLPLYASLSLPPYVSLSLPLCVSPLSPTVQSTSRTTWWAATAPARMSTTS